MKHEGPLLLCLRFSPFVLRSSPSKLNKALLMREKCLRVPLCVRKPKVSEVQREYYLKVYCFSQVYVHRVTLFLAFLLI